MSTMTVPEVRLPKVDLSQIDLPKIDLSHLELPKVELPDIDLPREIEDRLPGRRRTNPLPFVAIGLAIVAAGVWLVAWSPLAPRIRAAVSDARVRLGIDPSTAEPTTDDGERLGEYDVDPAMFAEPEPFDGSSSSPAFEPDRSAVEQERVATLGS